MQAVNMTMVETLPSAQWNMDLEAQENDVEADGKGSEEKEASKEEPQAMVLLNEMPAQH